MNEELQSANEEAQSANEEMQSVNEELETSKEEIQSSNEELATVNDELNNRNAELNALNNDLTNVLAGTQLSIIIVSRDLRIRRFTPVAEKTFNLAGGDLGRQLGDIKLSLAIPGLEPLLREVIDSVSSRERDVQNAQGRWFSLRARPYLTHENRIDGAVVTLVDVDSLRRARDYAESIVANVRTPLVVLDATLRVKTASVAFYRHFRVAPEETEGRHLYDLGNRQWDIPALRILLEEVLPREQAVEDYEVRHTFELLGPRTMLLNARRLAEAPDDEPLILLSLEDITVREAAEAAVRESEERYRSIIGSSPDCIKMLDLEGRLLSLEAGHALLGIEDPAPLYGTSWIDFWKGDADRTAASAAVAAAASGGEGHFVGFFRTLNGLDKWWDVAVTPVHDATGQPARLLAVSRDVTGRRELENALIARAEDLAQADRRKDEFLAMLAHELRNPLAALRSAAELLMENGGADDDAQAQQVIGRQIENMSRMLDDLLDVSRITEGKILLRRKPVALQKILAAAVSLVRSPCTEHRQELTIVLPDEPVYLNADATRLEQVFGNLLGNACKYSGDGSHIAVRAWRDDGEVVVSVSDDGAGIDPELLPRIFDLFVQASRTLDRSHGGLGIGLTLVQRLVNLHGGSIQARSEGPGHGAEFIVRLPILDGTPPPALVPSAPFAARETPRRILIVDDNHDSARSLEILQKRRGHEIRTAFSGPDAVAAATEFLPEVILLDIGLPGMDGFEVARRIRALPALQGVFLVAMSGYGQHEDLAKAKTAGFDEYLVKPVETARLWELIRNVHR